MSLQKMVDAGQTRTHTLWGTEWSEGFYPAGKVFCYFGASFFTALLNTLFFMGYLVLVFYKSEYVMERVAKLGALNPFHFVILFVGVNGLFELITTTIIGGGVSKGVDYAINRKKK